MEAAAVIEKLGGEVVSFAALANRGFCQRDGSSSEPKAECKLPKDVPFFALDDFEFAMYTPDECPLCAEGSQAIKPGSRS